MTTLFNVFVSGIAPDKNDQVDAIRENTAQMFKLKGNELDALLDNTIETCIRRKVSEAEAKKYQKAIFKLGLICTIKENKVKSSLSLEEIEKPDDKDDDIFSCPSCEFSKPLNGKPKPLVCESCGAKVLLEEKKLMEQEEREEIKKRLLQGQQYRAQLEQKEAQKEAEKTRRLLLEENVKNELGLNDSKSKDKKSLRTNIIISALASVCLVAFLLAYFAKNEENAIETASTNSEEFESFDTATSSETEMANALEAVENSSEEFEQSSDAKPQNEQIATGAESQNFQQATTQVDYETMESAAPSQGAMADTFSKAEATLNAFGLSTAGIAKAGKGQSHSKGAQAQQTTLEEFETLEATSISQTAMAETFKSAQDSLQTSVNANNNPLADQSFNLRVADLNANEEQYQGMIKTLPGLLRQLYGEFNNEFEWNNFLLENTEKLIENNKLSYAYQLAANIGNSETHVNAIGKIAVHLKSRAKVVFAKKLIAQLQEKYKQTKQIHPEILAQIALYQTKVEGSSALFKSALSFEKNITSPIKQIFSKGKIAVYQKQAGLDKEAYQNFLDAKQLLSEIKKPVEKIQVLIAISENYFEIGEAENGGQHLSSALSLIEKVSTLETRSKYFCKAVNALLLNNQNEHAMDLIAKIDLPEYQALALTSIVSKTNSSDLLTAINSRIQAAKSPVNQAIIASTSARKLFNSGFTSNASELFDIAEGNIHHISSIAEKDKVLAIMARNYALSDQLEKGNAYSEQISDNQHKNLVQKGITRLGNLIKKIS